MSDMILLSRDGDLTAAFITAAKAAGIHLTAAFSAEEAASLANGGSVDFLLVDEADFDTRTLAKLTSGSAAQPVPIVDLPDAVKRFSSPDSAFFIDRELDHSRVADALLQLSRQERGSISSAHRQDTENYLVSRFWQDVALGVIESEDDVFFKAEGIGLERAELTVLPILLEIKGWKSEFSLKQRHLSTQTIIKSAKSSFSVLGCTCLVFRLMDQCLFVLLSGESPGLSQLTETCGNLADFSETELGVTLVCCIGETTDAAHFSGMSKRMLERSGQNIFCEKVVYLRFSARPADKSETAPSIQQWKLLLGDMRFDQATSAITDYFTTAVSANGVGADWLGRFMADFNQMINVLLSEKGIAAHLIFKADSDIYTSAVRSAAGMLAYVVRIIDEYSRYCESSFREQSAVQSAVSYIKSNLGSPMTRNEIADHVHLSQNYLARIFKKETGMSISDYIVRERIGLAVELLTYTSAPLGEVAAKVGYDNYSYFYTIFRKLMGVKPSEYREKFASAGGKDDL